MAFKKMFVYCNWLLLWSVLFWLDIVSLSPATSLLGGLIFTFIDQIFYYRGITSILFKVLLIIFELLIFIVIFLKKPDVSMYDLFANVGIFFMYNVFLSYNNTTFYQVYAKILPSIHRKNKSYVPDIFF
jgi:hypothetical protein